MEYDAGKDSEKAVKMHLLERGLKLREVEDQLGLVHGTLSRAIKSGPLDKRSKIWPKLLDFLGLEIVIRPKKTQTP